MQTTPKKSLSRNGSSDMPKKTSPITPRSTRRINVAASESDSAVSASPGMKTPATRSPKVVERRSPRSPVTEKKRLSRVAELESQLTQLQDDLKKAKDQLASSESCKRQAEQEAEEAKKQSMDAAAKLEEAQRQLQELYESEDGRVHELRKIGQERDRAWQSELEAVQKQQTVDSTALFSAMNEVQKLKVQVEQLASSEVAKEKQVETAENELLSLKDDMAEKVSLINSLRDQLNEAEKTEEEYQILINETQVQLEMAKSVVDTLKTNGLKATEAFNSVVAELQESNAQVRCLEETLEKMNVDGGSAVPCTDHNESSLTTELSSLRSEVEQLKAALEETEARCQEEQNNSAMQIQSAYEEVEHTKVHSTLWESELELMLQEAKAEAGNLKANLMDKERQLQSLSDLKERLNDEDDVSRDKGTEADMESKLQRSIEDIAELKANLDKKEKALLNVLEENDSLKLEIEKKEAERVKSMEAAKAEADVAKVAEQEALMKIGIVTEEADKNSRRAARMTEQLEAAQMANAEIEAELKRLRIQSDQWRKAAEAAAAILTNGNDGKSMERSGSFDPDYNSLGGKLLNSPFSDDMDDESPKKKNNMLKKIGVLWKKGQK